MRPLVEVEHLTKIYEPSPSWMKLLLKSSITEPVTAVADLSLEVWPGQVFAVVGPNGAGKSTLFRVLTGLITPTSGRVALAGIDVIGDARKARRHIGFMPAEDRSLNLRHTCWQNLAFHGRLQGIPSAELGPRIDAVLETVGLGHVPDRTGHALSSGMRARLQLARALLHEPDILVLDEPTGTIDPIGAHDLLQLVQRLAAERQLAVLLSSHRLEEIDALEDNVLFINKGEVVHTGSMDSLRDVMEQPLLRLRFDSPASARQAYEHLVVARELHVSVDDDEVHVAGDLAPGRRALPPRGAPGPRRGGRPQPHAAAGAHQPAHARRRAGATRSVGGGAAAAGRRPAPTDRRGLRPASHPARRIGARPEHAQLAWCVVAPGPVRGRRRPGERGEQRRRPRSERVGRRVRLARQRVLRQRTSTNGTNGNGSRPW